MIEKLYLFNLSLLITHEIDSAFWHEWEMFHLPGGIQFFNIINFILILILIYGFATVVRLEKKGYIYSLLISITGLTAFFIHGSFIFFGYEQFILPVSLLILLACFILSVWQLIYTIWNRDIFISG